MMLGDLTKIVANDTDCRCVCGFTRSLPVSGFVVSDVLLLLLLLLLAGGDAAVEICVVYYTYVSFWVI